MEIMQVIVCLLACANVENKTFVTRAEVQCPRCKIYFNVLDFGGLRYFIQHIQNHD